MKILLAVHLTENDVPFLRYLIAKGLYNTELTRLDLGHH